MKALISALDVHCGNRVCRERWREKGGVERERWRGVREREREQEAGF